MPRDWLNLSWKLLLARGVIAVLFGIAAMVWPLDTALALVLLWGFWALFDSAGSFVQAFERGTPGAARLLLVVMGLVALVAAFLAIFSPAMTAVTLTWILGIWLIVRGIFEGVGALVASGAAPRGLLLASAAVDVLLGILFVANPGRGALGIAFVLGLVAFVWGVIFLVMGFAMRRRVAGLDQPAPTLGA
ncbi:HdeD family acid-resistance protein [Pimelobacter simplex]|uniref:HdeD family acid-resistance protein n=1 Tax=Nocardioides simplex TaxID=2045 RepID=UPI003AB09B03